MENIFATGIYSILKLKVKIIAAAVSIDFTLNVCDVFQIFHVGGSILTVWSRSLSAVSYRILRL